MNFVVGIDPGTKGGIAVLDDSGGVVWTKAFRPDMTLVEFVEDVGAALDTNPRGVFLEKVGHKRGDGSRGSFTFGGAMRAAEIALLSHGVKPKYVPPVFWQARLECLSGGDKSVTLRRAKELFGNQVKVTHGIADALLIAEYGRRCLA